MSTVSAKLKDGIDDDGGNNDDGDDCDADNDYDDHDDADHDHDHEKDDNDDDEEEVGCIADPWGAWLHQPPTTGLLSLSSSFSSTL